MGQWLLLCGSVDGGNFYVGQCHSGWLLCRSVDGRKIYVGQWLLLCGSVDGRKIYTVVCEPLHRCHKIFELKTFHLLTGRTIGHN